MGSETGGRGGADGRREDRGKGLRKGCRGAMRTRRAAERADMEG